MNRPKIRIKIDKHGNAVITEGMNSFLAKVIAAKGKIKVNTPRFRGELKIVSKLPEEKPKAKKPAAKKPASKKNKPKKKK